jgi:hypothetical protein
MRYQAAPQPDRGARFYSRSGASAKPSVMIIQGISDQFSESLAYGLPGNQDAFVQT